MKNQTVIGVFADKNQAKKAVDALKGAGYSDAHIDMMARDNITDNNMRDQRDTGIGGFFSNMFSDDDDSRRLHETARRGTVVTVHTDQMPRAEKAADILDQWGAIDAKEADTQLRKCNVEINDKDTTLDVIKENLTVGKQTVNTGGVRLRSRIINKPVEESIRLREENVFINRTPVDRKASQRDFDSFKEGTVTMTETTEVPVINKTARVVEQVSLGKQAQTHTETIRENVRETKVDVERMGAAQVANTSATGVNTKGGIKDALDRDNDGELIDLNDKDGRIG